MLQRLRRSFRRKRASYCVTCENGDCGHVGCGINRDYENVYNSYSVDDAAAAAGVAETTPPCHSGGGRNTNISGRRGRLRPNMDSMGNENEYVVGPTGAANTSPCLDGQNRMIREYYRQEIFKRVLAQYGGNVELTLEYMSNPEVFNGFSAAKINAPLGYHAGVVRKSSLEHHENGQQQQAPALPPRAHKEPPPRVPAHLINDNNPPPPPPPPRGLLNPPPTPPRGHTPPPMQPPLLRRMSPVPKPSAAGSVISGPASSSSSVGGQRGQSPVAPHPLRVTNSREITAQLNQQLQSMSIFPVESGAEPPPPYPMGNASSTAPPPPPPSYERSMVMRQSPTLSATSSDYRTASTDFRRSPGPLHQSSSAAAVAAAAAAAAQSHVTANILYPQLVNAQPSASPMSLTMLPGGPSASPASSMMSNSSRTSSSMQAWSARQTKTHSPIIMQSVKSTQVQKPMLQTATEPAVVAAAAAAAVQLQHSQMAVQPEKEGYNPPPTYEISMWERKHQVSRPQVMPPSPNPSPAPVAKGGGGGGDLPPPPPYPSTAVGSKREAEPMDTGLVSGTNVPAAAKQVPVISTAKVVHNRDATAKMQQRKFSSPMTTSDSGSRSDSPISDSHTISASPEVSMMSDNSSAATTTSDSGVVVATAAPTTHHTSPKPERKHLSPEKETRRECMFIRNCPPGAYKFYMEQRIENVMKEFEQRRKRQMRLEQELVEFKVSDPFMRNQMRLVLQQKETNHLRMKRAKLNKKHFKKIKKIGVGAFGEVSLVRSIASIGSKSGALYALKTLKKRDVVVKNQVAHVIAEKDILAEADNDWIVKLYYSFQDVDNLYFVMEYIPGGDLMSLLIKLGKFEEDLARFYIAELTCAVESVHHMGFIHRDIKPDNILIDAQGHIKLTDFGLCTGFRWTHNSKYYSKNGDSNNVHCRQDSMDPGTLDLDVGRCSCHAIKSSGGMKPLERRKHKQQQLRCQAHSLVGTPNYIAPEVLLTGNQNKQGYTQACDWWSVGVILYEMVVGQPPFLADTPRETQHKVIYWEQTLKVPHHARLSNAAEDLIKGLIVSHDRRLGRTGGSEEIKNHPFFHGIDFSKPLRLQKSPYKPEIMHELDTSNFDPIEDRDDDNDSGDDNNGMDHCPSRGQHEASTDYHGFYEFTFRRFFNDSGHSLNLNNADNQFALNNFGGGTNDGGGGGGVGADGQVAGPDAVYV